MFFMRHKMKWPKKDENIWMSKRYSKQIQIKNNNDKSYCKVLILDKIEFKAKII